MAWRTGNATDGYAAIFGSNILTAGNSFAIFGTGMLRVNNGGASRLCFTVTTSPSLKYRGIATNGAGTGIYLDGQGGTSSAITVGLNAPFAWCMRFNGLGAGAGSLFVRMLGSNTVTKVTCTTDADWTPSTGFLCFGDTTFSERWDGDVGQIIVYDGAAGAGLTDAQVEQQLQVARPIWPNVRAWYPTHDDVEANTLIDRSGNGYTLTDNGTALDITPNPAHPFGAPMQLVGAGAASSSATVAGQTLTATASVIAGAISGQSNATVSGQTLTAAASLIAGAAAGQSNATVAGQTLTATASLIAGAASGVQNQTVAGQILTATASLIAGAASGVVNATVGGQVLTAIASLISGGATGDAPAGTSIHRRLCIALGIGL